MRTKAPAPPRVPTPPLSLVSNNHNSNCSQQSPTLYKHTYAIDSIWFHRPFNMVHYFIANGGKCCFFCCTYYITINSRSSVEPAWWYKWVHAVVYAQYGKPETHCQEQLWNPKGDYVPKESSCPERDRCIHKFLLAWLTRCKATKTKGWEVSRKRSKNCQVSKCDAVKALILEGSRVWIRLCPIRYIWHALDQWTDFICHTFSV